MVWHFHLFQNFPQFIVVQLLKGFGIVNKAELDVFLELSSFFDDLADVGNLISDSSAFSKTSLNILSSQFTFIREMQIKTIVRYHLTLVRMTVILKRQEMTCF